MNTYVCRLFQILVAYRGKIRPCNTGGIWNQSKSNIKEQQIDGIQTKAV